MTHHPAKQRLQRACLTSSSIINTQASSVFHVISFRHFSPHLRCHSFFVHQRCLSIIKGEKCCTPFTFLNRYGHTLHCIAHKSVQLRSIPFIHFAQSSLLQPKGSGSPLPCPSVMRHLLSSTVAKGYCATFHYVIIPEFLYDSVSHGEVLHYHFITFHFIPIRFG